MCGSSLANAFSLFVYFVCFVDCPRNTRISPAAELIDRPAFEDRRAETVVAGGIDAQQLVERGGKIGWRRRAIGRKGAARVAGSNDRSSAGPAACQER
jgi:hypothetical protein